MAKIILLVILVLYLIVSLFYFGITEGKNKKYFAVSAILSLFAICLASIN